MVAASGANANHFGRPAVLPASHSEQITKATPRHLEVPIMLNSERKGLTSVATHFGHEAAADSVARPGSRPPQIGARCMVLPFNRAHYR